MQNISSITIACLIVCSNLIKAQQEAPIEISPYIGDKLDRVERDYFGFLPKIEGFQEAVFYLNMDSSLKAVIKYEEDGNLKDTIITSYKSLSNVQNQILQILTYRLNDVEPDERGKYCSVFLIDSSKCSGELLAVRLQSVLIYPFDQKSYEDEINPFKRNNQLKTQNPFNVNNLYTSEIDYVYFKEKSRFWSIIYPIIGGIAGAIIGYNLASANSNDNSASSNSSGGSTQINFNFGPSEQDKKNFYGILGGMVVGTIASIPLVLFLPIETTSEAVIKTPFSKDDLEGLRDRSRYKDNEPYYLQIIK